VPFLLSPQAKLRYQEVNIFSDITIVKTSNQEIANDHNAWWSKIIHNRRVLYSQAFLGHYFDQFNPNFLFIKGDGNPKFSTQDVGELYLWDFVFFAVGIFLLFRKKEGNWFIIPIWLLLGIIPAATARETPHALRIEATLPTFQIFVGYGIVHVISYFKSRISNLKIMYIFSGGLIILLLFNIFYFLHGYYTHYPNEFSGEWQYGYKESIAYVNAVKSQYDQIHITQSLGRPYVYYLFYSKTDPTFFRQTASIHRDTFGFVDVSGFGIYYFDKTLNSSKSTKILFVDIPNAVPGNAKVQKTFYLLNGNPAVVAYTL